MLAFGRREAGRAYVVRPGSYAVLFGGGGRIALVRTQSGLHLPGGGADPGESAEETLRREVLEECGASIDIVRRVGDAIEYVHAIGEGHFEKVGTFFEARWVAAVAEPQEPDHVLAWCTTDEALTSLRFDSQRWAVGRCGVR